MYKFTSELRADKLGIKKVSEIQFFLFKIKKKKNLNLNLNLKIEN
jgi:hypothetical protein